MQDMIKGLMDKVGLDERTAQKVVAFLQENAQKVPEWLASSGLADKLPGSLGGLAGSLGGMFGGKDKDR